MTATRPTSGVVSALIARSASSSLRSSLAERAMSGPVGGGDVP
jgi:hypothetical protein